MRLLIGDKFFDSFIQLPKRIQKKVIDFQEKFVQNRRSSAINLESISTFKDQSLRTARVDQKYRAIIGTIDGKDDYYLLWVDNHDEAMAWAENKTFEWNSVTNSPQLYTVETAEKEVEQEPDWEELYGYTEPNKTDAIKSLSDDELISLGVPEKLLDDVKEIDSFSSLEKLEKRIPEEVFEHLFYLLDGVEYSDVVQEVEESKQEEEGDSLLFKRFYVEVDDELLQRMLDGDLEKWSLFLHPSQRVLVNRDFNGSIKVTGGAGTGKTVAALHRLKYLTDKCSGEKQVLFATYTNALKRNLDEQVQKLNINERSFELSTIDSLAQNLAKQYSILNEQSTIAGLSNTISASDTWEKILEKEVTSFDLDFLVREVKNVFYYYDISDREEYFNQTRFGRGTPISRRQRLEVWKLFEKYQAYKKEHGIIDRLELFNLISNYLNKNSDERPFQHVILDEVQDCSNVEIRFIRALAHRAENDLFLVGDPYQSIYSRKVVFSEAGVNIRGGRSKKLKVNYRTTEEIKRYAVSALKGVRYDDFDESEEDLAGYVSMFHGTVPEYEIFDTKTEEVSYLIDKISNIEENVDRVDLSDIVIATRTKDSYREIMTSLHKNDIEYFDLRDDTGYKNGVHLCTFHSLKGLEYKVVLLADVNSRTCPYLPYRFQEWNKAEQEAHLNSEKSLLYTAMTRAIMELGVTGVGDKSEIIV